MIRNHIDIDPISGEVTAHIDGEIALRWPTVKQWSEIRVAYAEAQNVDRSDRPFAKAFARVVGLLSSSPEPDPEKLPIWCDDPNIFNNLQEAWTPARIGESQIMLPPHLVEFHGIDDEPEAAVSGG